MKHIEVIVDYIASTAISFSLTLLLWFTLCLLFMPDDVERLQTIISVNELIFIGLFSIVASIITGYLRYIIAWLIGDL